VEHRALSPPEVTPPEEGSPKPILLQGVTPVQYRPVSDRLRSWHRSTLVMVVAVDAEVLVLRTCSTDRDRLRVVLRNLVVDSRDDDTCLPTNLQHQ